jgi:hypothetical protein
MSPRPYAKRDFGPLIVTAYRSAAAAPVRDSGRWAHGPPTGPSSRPARAFQLPVDLPEIDQTPRRRPEGLAGDEFLPRLG